MFALKHFRCTSRSVWHKPRIYGSKLWRLA